MNETAPRADESAANPDPPPRHVPEFTFGDRIRKIRTTVAEMDQRQFAELIGYTHGAVAQWERDITRPRDLVGIAVRIENQYGVPVDWILGIDIERERQRRQETERTDYDATPPPTD